MVQLTDLKKVKTITMGWPSIRRHGSESNLVALLSDPSCGDFGPQYGDVGNPKLGNTPNKAALPCSGLCAENATLANDRG